MCYVGQNYPLRIPVPADGDLSAQLDAAFHRKHRELYGFASANEPTTIVNIRLTAIGAVDRPLLKPLSNGDGNAAQALKGTRCVFFDDAVECPIYERSKLDAGDRLSGPAIIEQMDSTTVVPPRCAVYVDASGLLIITVSSDTE
jgi:N-methylhydantoinase A